MKIFPAIDIKDKKCVRLIKGDFENKTEYEISPVEQAGKYKDNGFKNLHIVDLDGALTGEPININIIEVVTDTHNAPVTGAPLFHMVAKVYLKDDNKKQLMEKLNAIESDFSISVELEKI